MSQPLLLEIENLHFAIERQPILRNISVGFAAGGIHGLIGPNGSGKSTLLKNLCRIWRPQSGQVRINGQDYQRIGRKALSRLVTLVQQDTRVDFSISVADFITMGRHPHLQRLQGLRQRDLDVVKQAMQLTETESLKDRWVNELSGGEGQLVSIARALATEAPLILLDEPTSALDIRHKLDIMELLSALRNSGKTILISIHDLELARRFCDTITILQQGEVFFHGPTLDAFAQERVKEVFHVDVEEMASERGVSLLFY
ncbi:MAG: ABC transporter ATP-binding protein [Syntrophotaleaceae bacterium]